MSDRFHIVKKYIDQMDYYALLASGAPTDEFDTESREISRQITSEMTSVEIAYIIAKVFNSYFGEQDDADIFLSVAENIKKDIDLLNP